MRREWLIFSEAERELQPYPRLLRSPSFPLTRNQRGRKSMFWGTPQRPLLWGQGLEAWLFWQPQLWGPELELGNDGFGFQDMLYLICGLGKPKCQSIMIFIISDMETVWNLEWECLCSSLSFCRKTSLTLLYPTSLYGSGTSSLCAHSVYCSLIIVFTFVVTTSRLSSTVGWAPWEWGQCLDHLCILDKELIAWVEQMCRKCS